MNKAEQDVIDAVLAWRQGGIPLGGELLIAISRAGAALEESRKPRDPIQAVREWMDVTDMESYMREELWRLLDDLERERKELSK